MVMSVGLGGEVSAMFHLTTHAFFKALLFLGAGSVIHSMHEEQDIQKMGGLHSKMPVTSVTFLLAAVAIAGADVEPAVEYRHGRHLGTREVVR